MSCTTRHETPRGVVEDRKVFSYRGRDSSYVVSAFIPNGQVWIYIDRPDGSAWTFDLQSDRPNATQRRLRMILTILGDTLRVVEQSSENDGPWQNTEDNRQIRVGRTP